MPKCAHNEERKTYETPVALRQPDQVAAERELARMNVWVAERAVKRISGRAAELEIDCVGYYVTCGQW